MSEITDETRNLLMITAENKNEIKVLRRDTDQNTSHINQLIEKINQRESEITIIKNDVSKTRDDITAVRTIVEAFVRNGADYKIKNLKWIMTTIISLAVIVMTGIGLILKYII